MSVNIKKLISQMTMDEKIGQLFQLGGNYFDDDESAITGPMTELGFDIKDIKNVGNVLGVYGAETMRRIQDKHLKEDRNKIPLIFMLDVIHGFKTIYPIPLALGATFNPEIVGECSKMAAKEACTGGVQVTFAPMLDYVRDARWGRVMESCGEDPYLNGVMGKAQIQAFQGDDLSKYGSVCACVKHFAAYGGAEAGRDYNTVELSERTLRNYYFPAYKAGVEAGVGMIMTSFNDLNGVPSTANRHIMQDILKKEWKFKGVVISDYAALDELIRHRVAENLKEATKMSINNDLHIEMMSLGYYKYLKELVASGEVSEKTIDTAVEKVLTLKKKLGLFENPYHFASVDDEGKIFLCEEHRDIAKRAALESAVLLKNDGVLPFSKDVKNIALIGPFADTGDLNGAWSCWGDITQTVSVKEGIEKLLPNAHIEVVKGCSAKLGENDTSEFKKAEDVAKKADIVILCLGEPAEYSGESCSRVDIKLPGVQEELARVVANANKNTACVLFNGRPLALTEINDTLPAILDMFFPGSEGGNACAELLFGDANPSGKITMSFPKAVGQCPIYYNHFSVGRPKGTAEDVFEIYSSDYIDCGIKPLYSFGYGLSYAKFEYESLELSGNKMSKDDKIKVTVKVKNVGDVCGKEVVQLYLRDEFSTAKRPECELIGFEKISLNPGETKAVEFEISEPMLRYYNFDCKYVSEKGEFKVFTGCSEKLLLEKSFELI